MDDEPFLVVGAIDIGTSFSGYAFAFTSKPGTIHMNKNWGSEMQCERYKTPTSVLTDEDGEFHSFGYVAEYEYLQLDKIEVKKGCPNTYNLYHHFKMVLYREKISLQTEITSTGGYTRKAIDIFTMAIKYLFEHMMNAIQQQLKSSLDPSNICVVLTVPAIWTNEAKDFMRQAAHRAGIISKNLILALEPEAASIFCRTIDVDSDTTRNISVGERMLVVDAGGGTVDVTVHEIEFDKNVKEVTRPTGGSWGGEMVDGCFADLLKELLGDTFIHEFKKKYPQEWFTIMKNFDTAKRAFNSNEKSKINVDLGYTITQVISSSKNKSITSVFEPFKHVSFNNGFLRVEHQTAYHLFADAVRRTVEHVKAILNRVTGVKYVLLVGGFGESDVLKKECEKGIGANVHLLTPIEAQTAVVKGAVLFGLNPRQISSRIARYTYGTGSLNLFKASVHDSKRMVIDDDGDQRCEDCFDVFVTRDEEVTTGKARLFYYKPATKGQTKASFRLYKADKTKAMYIDEEGVVTLGQVRLESSNGPLGQDLEVRVTFGHTELMVEARDKSKNEDFKVNTVVEYDSCKMLPQD